MGSLVQLFGPKGGCTSTRGLLEGTRFQTRPRPRLLLAFDSH